MKSPTLLHPDLRQRGFTLVELLVACSILALLVVLVAQMVGSASSVTGNSKKRLDADDEARLVFDRLAGDINGMVKRRDINPLFLASNGNDSFYFYSQAPAYSTNAAASNSQVALIGYAVTNSGIGLVRFSAGQSWDGLRFSNPSLTSITATSPTNFHVIAPNVFRMEFALLMKPGSVNNTNGLGPVTNVGTVSINGTNVIFQTNNAGQACKDVSGIVLAIALLDPTSRQVVGTNALTALASLMGDANIITEITSGALNGSLTNGIPVDTWRTNALINSGIPPAARAQIRVYQRYIPINQ
jgi:prepilin-type N-terminal cleavage/methylation domain-containing protein